MRDVSQERTFTSSMHARAPGNLYLCNRTRRYLRPLPYIY